MFRLLKLAARPGRLVDRCQVLTDVALGHARRCAPQVRARHAGADPHPASLRHLVYVHYDPAGRIHDFTLAALEDVVRHGYRVTFVSNAPRLARTQVARVVPYCRVVLHRWNNGYDFGAYKDGIHEIGPLDSLQSLVLLNDSVYGPLFPLDEFFAKAGKSEADLYGVTDNWEHGYHVQSYCLLFKPPLLAAPFFRKFWRRAPYVNEKVWTIMNHEVGLTRLVVRKGHAVDVLCPFRDLARRALKESVDLAPIGPDSNLPARLRRERAYFDGIHDHLAEGGKLNATHYFWRPLIEEFRCPFIKRDLIAHNPMKIPDIWQWRDVIERRTSYDPALIERHLKTL